ncbi:radical SAM family heme chaperone HemW [Litorisediminicola beolgyonensis]|uniref:Heme chaperone HemW n=1 Tax=Litorisediminicola beolgyonensis TaxID=1173614 RepID=A0ABW3ZEN1_9RHOB
MADDWDAGGFGLYIHWPFCEAKCPYCDFNSHVAREIDEARWRRAYLSEIERVAKVTGGRHLRSVFFGGGTPSLMAPDTVDAILAAVRRHWQVGDDLEITLEANPRSVEAGRFREFGAAGVNRVSMGLQALNDTDLKRLGRLHSVAEAKTAFDTARGVFERVSFDLIYARQDQSLSDWEAELRQALSMAVDHLSLYQLTIERGTAFWERARSGRLSGLPGEDLSADLYERTTEICDAAGLPAYEVSNHARPGAESRHNLVYWRYGDYVGIGPGAHGRVTLNGVRSATEAWRNPGAWLENAERKSGDRVNNALQPQDQAYEYLMMGLRITEGLDLERLRHLDPAQAPDEAITGLEEIGLVWRDNARIGVTQSGRLVLNSVIEALAV